MKIDRRVGRQPRHIISVARVVGLRPTLRLLVAFAMATILVTSPCHVSAREPAVEASTPSHDNLAALRSSSVALLKDSLRTEKEFVQIHAAEALVEHGEGAIVAEVLLPEVNSAPPIRRVGVWRTLARCATTPEERAHYVAKLRDVMLTPGNPDRIHATESLAKLGEKLPDDRAAIEELARISTPGHSCHCLWMLALAGDETAESRLVGLLEHNEPIPRLVAGVVLSRLPSVSAAGREKLFAAAEKEPADSPACGYLLAAALLVCDDANVPRWKTKLLAQRERGTIAEKYEASLALGLRGDRSDLERLRPDASQAGDVRIGNAQGTLRLIQRLESTK